MVTYAERLTCSGAGYVLDKRSMSIKAPPPDQSVLLEKDPVNIGARIVRGALRRARVFRDRCNFLIGQNIYLKNNH